MGVRWGESGSEGTGRRTHVRTHASTGGWVEGTRGETSGRGGEKRRGEERRPQKNRRGGQERGKTHPDGHGKEEGEGKARRGRRREGVQRRTQTNSNFAGRLAWQLLVPAHNWGDLYDTNLQHTTLYNTRPFTTHDYLHTHLKNPRVVLRSVWICSAKKTPNAVPREVERCDGAKRSMHA